MKKIFYTLMVLFLTSTVTFAADSVKVISMDNYSTETPAATYSAQIQEELVFPNGEKLQVGTIIKGNVCNIKNASRGKRNAYFEFYPHEYIYEGNIIKTIESPIYKARVLKHAPLDKKGLATSAGKGAAGILVKGASQGISFIQGMLQAENGNRFSSGAKKVYKDSPFSYIEKGEEMVITEGEEMVLKFYSLTEDSE